MDVTSSYNQYYDNSNYTSLSNNTYNLKQTANLDFLFYKQNEQQKLAYSQKNNVSIKENLILIDSLSASTSIAADAFEFEQILSGKKELPRKLFTSKNEAYPHGINRLRNKINSSNLVESNGGISAAVSNETG